MHHSACFSFPFTWKLTNAVPSAHFTYSIGVVLTQLYADLIFVFTGKSTELDNKHTQAQFDPCVVKFILRACRPTGTPSTGTPSTQNSHALWRKSADLTPHASTSRSGCSSTSLRSSQRTVRSLYSFILVFLQSSTTLEYFPEQNSTWKTCKNLSFLSHKKEKSPEQCNLAPSISQQPKGQKDLLLERMMEALTGTALLGWKSSWDCEQQLTAIGKPGGFKEHLGISCSCHTVSMQKSTAN